MYACKRLLCKCQLNVCFWSRPRSCTCHRFISITNTKQLLCVSELYCISIQNNILWIHNAYICRSSYYLWIRSMLEDAHSDMSSLLKYYKWLFTCFINMFIWKQPIVFTVEELGKTKILFVLLSFYVYYGLISRSSLNSLRKCLRPTAPFKQTI